jgi:glucokinase
MGSGNRSRSARGVAVTLGIDVGATKIRAALVSASGKVLEGTLPEPVVDRSPASVLRAVETLVTSQLDLSKRRPVAAGVAAAAQVDHARGSVRYAPNLGWANVPFGAVLGQRLGLPVFLENDVRAAAQAEWRVGAARGVGQVVLFWGGTGVGGGLVVDGRLLRGARGAAGELGHLTVIAGGRRCHCPNRGCLEAYVGGWGIAERAIEAALADPVAGRALLRSAGAAEQITAERVFAVAGAGDPLARRLVAETGVCLADGAVSIVNALNPSLVLLGGPVLSHWAGLPKFIESQLRARCQPPAARSVRVRKAALGDWSPMIGAALIAADRVGAGPRAAT